MFKLKCDQCNPLAINGIPTHEIGCPNAKFIWYLDDETKEVKPNPNQRIENVNRN